MLENNVGVLFQSDNINTIMPDSELRLTIMASIAQEEVRKLGDEIKANDEKIAEVEAFIQNFFEVEL